MKYVIDTNIFLRTLVREDEKTFKDCTAFLHALKENEFEAVVPGLVISEVVWTLQSYYKTTKEKSLKATTAILNLRGVSIVDDYQYRLALKLYQKTSCKFINACVASLDSVQKKDWIVVSYDRDFDKLNILREEPATIIHSP